ncbi:heavy metal-associated isoprenylated plant protein 27-like [Oryza brachyantha]|uniref:HMA domain-containing protein n=1 Tax=Oryza brachyantha TaxID=4533 RepID=J3LK57_ORYBR|nr:heavy metal-associated isoprenylated plant protein 27-like [Oryza brachyantha]
MGVDGIIAELRELPAKMKILPKKKHKQFQKVEVMVRMDCEGCERKVRKAVEEMKGVSSVEVDAKQNKVTVTGYVEQEEVAERLRRRTGKKAEPWPYVPYDVVPHPYAPGAYDKKAPLGYVRNALADPDAAPLARATDDEEKLASAFSDENPNSCSLM